MEKARTIIPFLRDPLDLPQVDCENAKASDSQGDESEGRSRESTCSACGIFNLICILSVPKKWMLRKYLTACAAQKKDIDTI